MKIYIWSDMEGTAGISRWPQVTTGSAGYAEACRLLTEEVNAAAEGAFAAGAAKVLVNDGHLAERNLDTDRLNPRVECLMGPGKNPWTGLDGSFDLMFLVGFHAKAGTPAANLRHTWSPREWVDLRINGTSLGEIGLAAAGAAEMGVPCALVTGDDKACLEASSLMPAIVTAAVKRSVSWQDACSLSPADARRLIKERARTACIRSERPTLPNLPGPEKHAEIIFLAEAPDPYMASSLESNELMSRRLLRRQATAGTVRDAFQAALRAPAESFDG